MEKQKSIKINVLLNSLSRLCTVIFPLITFPYISRVLQAENYGKISFGNSIVSYFSLIAALGITTYAIREGAKSKDDKREMERFASEIFTINLYTTIIAYFLLFILLITSYKLRSYSELIIIQSLVIICTTMGVDWLYSIYEDYLYITIRSIVVQLISLVLMFIFVKEADDYLVYAFIQTFAAGGSNIFSFIHSRKYIKLRLNAHPNFRVHLKPMLILFFNVVAISIYVSSDITILGFFKGDYIVGLYSVSVKIYGIVKTLLAAILVVSMPRISYYLHQGNIDKYKGLSQNILKMLLLFLLPSLVGLFLLSKEIITLLAGKEYVGASTSLQLLSLALVFSLVAAFFTGNVLVPNRREKDLLKATLVSALLNVSLNFIMIPWLSLNGAALTTVLAEITIMFMSIWFSKNLFDFKGFKNTFITVGIGCIGIIVSCLILGVFTFPAYLQLFLKVVISIVVYLIILIIGKNEMLFLYTKRFRRIS